MSDQNRGRVRWNLGALRTADSRHPLGTAEGFQDTGLTQHAFDRGDRTLTTYANHVVMLLPMLGLLTGLITPLTGALFMAVAWGIIMLFNLVTLPVEFDASRRAKAVLADFNFIAPGEEATGVRRVLDAAAWTYVAAFITSLAYFLWYLLPLLTGGRQRD